MQPIRSALWRHGAIVVLLTAISCCAVAQDNHKKRDQRDALERPVGGGAIVFEEKSRLPLPKGYKLVYEQTFDENSALNDFVMTDPGAWKVSEEKGEKAIELTRQSNYKPAVRSPVNIAMIGDRVFGDFIVEADMIQTGREYGHRDMCVFFGITNPTNFYYVHIATAADDHAHNIFIVRDAPRTKIAKETTKGVNWGLNVWHKVRVERRASEGTIKVFFDDMKQPIMVAEDKAFAKGYIGFGSFDDTGKVDNIRVWAPSSERKPAGFYSPARR